MLVDFQSSGPWPKTFDLVTHCLIDAKICLLDLACLSNRPENMDRPSLLKEGLNLAQLTLIHFLSQMIESRVCVFCFVLICTIIKVK